MSIIILAVQLFITIIIMAVQLFMTIMIIAVQFVPIINTENNSAIVFRVKTNKETKKQTTTKTRRVCACFHDGKIISK